jgi:hypothetical protein
MGSDSTLPSAGKAPKPKTAPPLRWRRSWRGSEARALQSSAPVQSHCLQQLLSALYQHSRSSTLPCPAWVSSHEPPIQCILRPPRSAPDFAVAKRPSRQCFNTTPSKETTAEGPPPSRRPGRLDLPILYIIPPRTQLRRNVRNVAPSSPVAGALAAGRRARASARRARPAWLHAAVDAEPALRPAGPRPADRRRDRRAHGARRRRRRAAAVPARLRPSPKGQVGRLPDRARRRTCSPRRRGAIGSC